MRYRGAGEVEEVMFKDERDKFLYLTEQTLKKPWRKDCPLCRGSGCGTCHDTGKMAQIHSVWGYRDADCVAHLDKQWVEAVAPKM